jgi:hypothetical protein
MWRYQHQIKGFQLLTQLIFIVYNKEVEEHFSQLWIVQRVSNVRYTEIYTAEPLIPDPSSFEAKMFIAKLKRYKLSGNDKTQAELIQARGETLPPEIHKKNKKKT